VAGDPADIRRTPIHVVVAEIEDELGRGVGADQVSARRVHDALRLSRRAGGVEDVEHVLGIHRLGIARRRRALHQVVVPVVAPFLELDGRRGADALDDDHVFNRRRAGQSFVGHLLQRDDLAAPVAAVGRDQQPAGGIVDAIPQRLGTEAAEDDVVDGADAGTREHRDRELGDER
jgi:hypothetical protein